MTTDLVRVLFLFHFVYLSNVLNRWSIPEKEKKHHILNSPWAHAWTFPGARAILCFLSQLVVICTWLLCVICIHWSIGRESIGIVPTKTSSFIVSKRKSITYPFSSQYTRLQCIAHTSGLGFSIGSMRLLSTDFEVQFSKGKISSCFSCCSRLHLPSWFLPFRHSTSLQHVSFCWKPGELNLCPDLLEHVENQTMVTSFTGSTAVMHYLLEKKWNIHLCFHALTVQGGNWMPSSGRSELLGMAYFPHLVKSERRSRQQVKAEKKSILPCTLPS